MASSVNGAATPHRIPHAIGHIPVKTQLLQLPDNIRTSQSPQTLSLLFSAPANSFLSLVTQMPRTEGGGNMRLEMYVDVRIAAAEKDCFGEWVKMPRKKERMQGRLGGGVSGESRSHNSDSDLSLLHCELDAECVNEFSQMYFGTRNFSRYNFPCLQWLKTIEQQVKPDQITEEFLPHSFCRNLNISDFNSDLKKAVPNKQQTKMGPWCFVHSSGKPVAQPCFWPCQCRFRLGYSATGAEIIKTSKTNKDKDPSLCCKECRNTKDCVGFEFAEEETQCKYLTTIENETKVTKVTVGTSGKLQLLAYVISPNREEKMLEKKQNLKESELKKVASRSEGCHLEYDWEITGTEMKQTEDASGGCCEWCIEDPQCRGFFWNYSSFTCHFFSEVVFHKRAEGAVSGYKKYGLAKEESDAPKTTYAKYLLDDTFLNYKGADFDYKDSEGEDLPQLFYLVRSTLWWVVVSVVLLVGCATIAVIVRDRVRFFIRLRNKSRTTSEERSGEEGEQLMMQDLTQSTKSTQPTLKPEENPPHL